MNDISSKKARLEEEKLTLESELPTVGRPNPAQPGDWEAVQSDTEKQADPNDQADLIEDYASNVSILGELEARYAEVTAALARIDTSTYGTCTVGGEDIEEDRLQADPAAPTCIAHLNS